MPSSTRRMLFLLILCLGFSALKAQNGSAHFLQPAPELNKGRLIGVSVGTAVLYGVSMYLLYRAWYKGHSRSRFHFFNDNREWLLMDKMGHANAAYNIGRGYYDLMRWSGVNNNQSAWIGGAVGLVFLTSIELFDGFSDGWGFSWGDIAANMAGAGLFWGQQFGWQEQKISMKVGWRKSIYPRYRPDLLGKSIPQQMLKDYNGQHAWLSFNIASLLPVGPDFPQWLNFAVGYSGNGMIGGHKNPDLTDPFGKKIVLDRYPQVYLGLDIDLPRVPTRYRSLSTLGHAIQFIKVPSPSLEFNRVNKVRFNPIFVRNK
jgi:uncharacterized protein YfiM (DUF2279 family)